MKLDGKMDPRRTHQFCGCLHVYPQVLRDGNGNPLQYSCLENPMDGGAWWAASHGVTTSQARLSDFTFPPWGRKWQSTPVSLPGESQGRGSLVGFRLCGRTESDTTEVTCSSSSSSSHKSSDILSRGEEFPSLERGLDLVP